MAFDPMFAWGLISVPLFLLCKTVIENKEKGANESGSYNTNHYHKAAQEFVDEYSDVELERKIKEYVNNRENHNEIYEYLGRFKEENSEWCFRNEIPAFENIKSDDGEIRACKIPNTEYLDWYNVDKKRFDLCQHANMATQMIVNSLGIWTEEQAEILFNANIDFDLKEPFPSYYQFQFVSSIDLKKQCFKNNPYL